MVLGGCWESSWNYKNICQTIICMTVSKVVRGGFFSIFLLLRHIFRGAFDRVPNEKLFTSLGCRVIFGDIVTISIWQNQLAKLASAGMRNALTTCAVAAYDSGHSWNLSSSCYFFLCLSTAAVAYSSSHSLSVRLLGANVLKTLNTCRVIGEGCHMVVVWSMAKNRFQSKIAHLEHANASRL